MKKSACSYVCVCWLCWGLLSLLLVVVGFGCWLCWLMFVLLLDAVGVRCWSVGFVDVQNRPQGLREKVRKIIKMKEKARRYLFVCLAQRAQRC